MPTFVLLRHEMPGHAARPLHWDFMMESGDVLRTWALAAFPQPDLEIVAEQLADHRRKYLDYEGPILPDRGAVTREDRGTFEVLTENAQCLRLRLRGRLVAGEVVLRRDEGHQDWSFRWTAT